MKLKDLLRDVDVIELAGSTDVDISAVTFASGEVKHGSVFVAVPGLVHDGAKFIGDALSKGASAIVSEAAPRGEAPFVRVLDAKAALATMAANFYGRASERLQLIGVTGTSGKTTTTRMIESILDATGTPVGLIGTIEYRAGDEREVADRTTPDAVTLHEWFAKMAEANVRYAVMEVSSHALALRRVHGVSFAAAVFTNLSRDHFDFHSDFEDYFAAKKMLFDQIDRSRRTAVVNLDDAYGQRLIADLGESAITFGATAESDIRPAEDFRVDIHGLRGAVETPFGTVQVESPLLGTPNLYNWLGAIGAALAVGIEISAIEKGISSLPSVQGRFERVPSEKGIVLVDYAHKPDALEKLLHAVRGLAGGKKITLVFGCGGDRDQGKRPLMGKIAGELADYSVLTSDNPRTERPEKIIDQIEKGIAEVPGARYERISDRRAAIERAIAGAGDDTVVVIAGKGHENYQVLGDQIVHFDDREEAELALSKKVRKW